MQIVRFLAASALVLVVLFSQFRFVEAKATEKEAGASGDAVDQWIESFEQFFVNYIVSSYQMFKSNRIMLTGLLVLVSGFLLMKTTSFVFGMFRKVFLIHSFLSLLPTPLSQIALL